MHVQYRRINRGMRNPLKGAAMSNQNPRDDALFEALGQSKKKHRRRIIRTVAITLAAVLVLGVAGIAYLDRRGTSC